MRELTCIICPIGCALRVYLSDDNKIERIEGNLCPRGTEFATQEILDPRRVVMTVIPVLNGDLPTVSVKTDKPVPKKCIEEIMKIASNLVLEAPIEIGQVVLKDICGANIVATRRVRKVK
ncbi:MAG: DUF1667 domain-containing protein [Ignisphaera sp.]